MCTWFDILDWQLATGSSVGWQFCPVSLQHGTTPSTWYLEILELHHMLLSLLPSSIFKFMFHHRLWSYSMSFIWDFFCEVHNALRFDFYMNTPSIMLSAISFWPCWDQHIIKWLTFVKTSNPYEDQGPLKSISVFLGSWSDPGLSCQLRIVKHELSMVKVTIWR